MDRARLCRTLGVAVTATKEECKKAFHKLAHVHHPDKGGDVAVFKRINAAYQEILKLPEYSAPTMTPGFGGFDTGFSMGGFSIVYTWSYDNGFNDPFAQQNAANRAAQAQAQQQARDDFVNNPYGNAGKNPAR